MVSKDSMIKGSITSRINKIYYDAKTVRRISYIVHTILGNACYSDREEKRMIGRGQNLGSLDDEELKLIHDSWDLRREMTKNKLIKELQVILDEYKRKTKEN